ncbi:hypothetical protein TRIUR3_15147 [Triticum urartu]|uniref:Uncharacterized protein n=1 Tax=Triticum urartu TaxID=4572 RepID=M8AB88_TRIUA|nr:uncharacterized protein LOC125517353 [Triticum urartu]XP_048538519.1 uncharacterized protein LOC125517366 [Triticum urartu]XP_048547238.1 uncharacterized protein LOC125526624 [Triticum urartu]EMS57799.1 hypothetical protein TRIUR3_15147 [Triticum urartu]
MARGKVAEWIRKRTMPRKSAARRQSKESGASEPILPSEAAPKSWSSSSGAPSGRGGGASTGVHSKSRASAFLSALLQRRSRVNVLAVLWEQVVYHMMWLVESVVVVGRLCFFLMRFGFKQL